MVDLISPAPPVNTETEITRVSANFRVGFDARWYNNSGVGTYVAELLKAMLPLRKDIVLVVYEDLKNPIPGLDQEPIERIPVTAGKYSLAGQFELRRRLRQDRFRMKLMI